MKKLLVILCLFLLCGCEFKSQHEANLENVEDCRKNGGAPRVTYCNHSDTICIVECFYNKED